MKATAGRARLVLRRLLGGSLLAFALLLLNPSVATAQFTFLGPSKCTSCHDHDRQTAKWQKEEPALFKGKAHYNTLKQLDAPKSAGWAKAIGLADAYDVKGSCVKCHASVFRGDANAGVSCESCHGPASGYLEPHQQKGSYAKSITQGLRDLKEKPPTIAKVCVDCHVVKDQRLVTAGHPSGSAYDAGESLKKLVHWKTAYNYAQVTAAGKSAGGARVAAAPAAPAPGAPAPAKPAAPPPAGPGAAAPPTVAAAPPGGAAPGKPAAPRPAAPAPAPAAPGPPPEPWDWDQPVRPLPADYVPEPAAAPEAAAPVSDEPGAAVPVPAAPAPPRPRRPPPVVPPSLAEETPFPQDVAGASGGSAVSPALTNAPAAATPAGPRPPAAEAALVRGGALAVLEKLLRAGARSPEAPAPAKPNEYSGPDGELLRLQDEVIALALEALRRPE